MATKDLAAWGNVLLREGEDVVECERLEVNLDTRLGKVYKAKLFLKDQNFHITGKRRRNWGRTVIGFEMALSPPAMRTSAMEIHG